MINPFDIFKNRKRPQVTKAPYALVNQLSLEGRLHKTKVIAIFDAAEDAYGESERLGLMAIYVPTLAHIGKVLYEVDIGKAYPVLRKYAYRHGLPSLEDKLEGWSCITTSKGKAAQLLAKELDVDRLDDFYLEEIDS